MQSAVRVPAPGLVSLDTDVLLHVLSFLSPAHLIQLSSTCKRLCTISRHPQLWQALCQAKWCKPSSLSSCSGQAPGWFQQYAASNGLLSGSLQADELQLQRGTAADSCCTCMAVHVDQHESIQVAVGQSGSVQVITLQQTMMALAGASASTASAAADGMANGSSVLHASHLDDPGLQDRVAPSNGDAMRRSAAASAVGATLPAKAPAAGMAGQAATRPAPSDAVENGNAASLSPSNAETAAQHATVVHAWYPTAHQSLALPENQFATSMSWLPVAHIKLPLESPQCETQAQVQPQLVVGTAQGGLHLYKTQQQHLASQAGLSAAGSPESSCMLPVNFSHTVRPQYSNLPVADILHLRMHSNQLGCSNILSSQSGTAQHQTPTSAADTTGLIDGAVAVLHDSYLRGMAWQEAPIIPSHRNHVRLYSADFQRCLGMVHDIMDGWQFVCMACLAAPISGSPNATTKAGAASTAPGSGHEALPACGELVLGSVAGPPCARCWQAGEPWLCYHKQPARAAAVCVVDWRAAHGLSARYSLHHRSLYPHLAVVHRAGSSGGRSQWVATSHAHSPLCIWDLRKMSSPLFEQVPLKNWTQGPMGGAMYSATHQGLWLTATEDVLLGRAANGCLWAWDLADVLGWADGSTLGRWQALEQVPTWVDSSEVLGSSHWPRCLGAPAPGLAGIPITQLLPQDMNHCGGPVMLTISSTHAAAVSRADELPSLAVAASTSACGTTRRTHEHAYTERKQAGVGASEGLHLESEEEEAEDTERQGCLDGYNDEQPIAVGNQGTLSLSESSHVQLRQWMVAHNNLTSTTAVASWQLRGSMVQARNHSSCNGHDMLHASQQAGTASAQPHSCTQDPACHSSQLTGQQQVEPEVGDEDDDRVDTLTLVCLCTKPSST